MGANLPLNPTGLVLPGKSIRMPQSRLAVSRGLVNYWPLSYDSINLATNKLDDISSGRQIQPSLTSVTGANLVDTFTGGGIAFNGSTNYALAGTPALSVSEISAPFSFSCWVNGSSFTGTQIFLAVGNGVGGTSCYLGFRNDVGDKFVFNADGSLTFAQSDTSPTTGKWYFLAGVASANAGGGIVLFINGMIQTATGSAWGGGASGSPDSTAIGAAISTGAKAAATIFECRIYNRALDAAEIIELYQTGLAGRRDRMFGLNQWDASALTAPAGAAFLAAWAGGSNLPVIGTGSY